MNTIFEVERELLIKQIPYSLFVKDRYIELDSYKYGRIRIIETVSINKFTVIRNKDVLVSLGTLKEVIDFVKKCVKPVEPVECIKIGELEKAIDTQLKIHQNGTVEIELRTITDTRLQYNDLYIQYLEKSNIVVIGYDITPAQVLYQFNVITKGEPVKFKARNNVGIFYSYPEFKVFDISNMELI